jgi:ABC-type branched-subunit amino acid transport system ATPase component
VPLVAQNARLAFERADHGFVPQTGSITLPDGSAALRDDPVVRKADPGV